MKAFPVLLFAACALTCGCVVAADSSVADWRSAAKKHFSDLRFGAFIHWGLYSAYAQGEWYLEEGKLLESDYARAKDSFCPSKFDAREWVGLLKSAGIRYVTITSRHHDGFSLWPTKVDDGYNVSNTPFKRDVLRELAIACKELDVQLNFYYSLMDWHRSDYPTGRERSARSTLAERVEDYASYKHFMMAQLVELLDAYQPGVIWFDGEWDHDPKWTEAGICRPLDWGLDEIYNLIHSRKALVANNHHHTLRAEEDIQLFERDLPGENESGFSPDSEITIDRPLEQCDVIQNGQWGYSIKEKRFRSSEEVVAMVARAAAKGSNLLMNIGPDGSGRFPGQVVNVLSKVGDWFKVNGESIYGTSAGGVGLAKDVVSTRRGNVLYLHFINPCVNKFAFSLKGCVVDCRRLDAKKTVRVERTETGDAVVSVGREVGETFDCVVKLTIGED